VNSPKQSRETKTRKAKQPASKQKQKHELIKTEKGMVFVHKPENGMEGRSEVATEQSSSEKAQHRERERDAYTLV